MRYLSPVMLFIEQASLRQPMGMLGDIFKIAAKFVRDFFQRQSVILRDQLQDGYSPMIGGTFEIAL